MFEIAAENIEDNNTTSTLDVFLFILPARNTFDIS